MRFSPFVKRVFIYSAILVGLIILAWVFNDPLIKLYAFTTDKELVKQFITTYDRFAAVVFILFQVVQVICAPIPGEATGFIGGYIFGATWGFFYSSIGLFIGSCINFMIGRFLGKAFIRKWIPKKTISFYDRMFKRQGVIALFVLFVFPGFPKDVLSYLAGISTIPLKLFVLAACFGRMPGTLALSLQGQFLFTEQFGLLALIFAPFVVLGFFCILFREKIYAWLERETSSF